MTVTVKDTHHHLVSYYSLDDAKYRLKTPRDDPVLENRPVSDALLSQKKFKYLNLDDNGEGPSGQMEPSSFSYPGDRQIQYAVKPHRVHPIQVPGMDPYQAFYARAYSAPTAHCTYSQRAPVATAYDQGLAATIYHPQHRPCCQQPGHQLPPYQSQQPRPLYQPQTQHCTAADSNASAAFEHHVSDGARGGQYLRSP